LIKKYTVQRYRIVTSEARILYDAIKERGWVRSAEVSGANTVTLVVKDSYLDTFENEIKTVSSKLKIQLYAIEKAETLEDAYNEVMQ
jgi:hypothetical protein